MGKRMPKDVKHDVWSMLRDECFAEHGRTCVYCGKAPATVIDHVLPESRGGKSTPDNLLPSCNSCNITNGNRTHWEWFRDNLSDLRELSQRRSQCLEILGKSIVATRRDP